MMNVIFIYFVVSSSSSFSSSFSVSEDDDEDEDDDDVLLLSFFFPSLSDDAFSSESERNMCRDFFLFDFVLKGEDSIKIWRYFIKQNYNNNK